MFGSKGMKHYSDAGFEVQKSAVNIRNLLSMIYAYSIAMFLTDLILQGGVIFVLAEILVMSLAMALVFGLWYRGFMDVSIFIAGFYGVAFSMLIYFDEAHMRFDMQMFIVLIVTVLGFRLFYQYAWTLLVVVPLIVARMLQDDQLEWRYVVFMLLTIGVTTYLLIIFKNMVEEEVATAYSLKVAQETDILTGLPNRRSFENNYRDKEANRQGSILLVDLDHFKRVNDTYGHSVGDQVLLEFSGVLASLVSDKVKVFRWGGEEFLMICMGTDEEAFALGEKVRLQTESAAFSIPETLTASIGIASTYMGDRVLKDCFFNADKALYQAKEEGRNRVVAHLRGE